MVKNLALKFKNKIKSYFFQNTFFLKLLNRLNRSVENSGIHLPLLQIKDKSKTSLYLPLLKYDFEVHARIHKLIQILGSGPSSRVEHLVRFGNQNDGGYSIIDDLKLDDVLISFGVGSDISFEKSLEFKVKEVHFYDYSVEELPCKISNSHFFREKVGIGEFEVRINDALSKFSGAGDYLLKCDIEGSEWEVLNNADRAELLKFRQIVIEFHGLGDIVNLGDFLRMEAVFSKLASTHELILIQPNNYGEILTLGNVVLPSVFEATYYRRANLNDLKEVRPNLNGSIAHQNCVDRPPMRLGFPWM
jgi:hypothetical protein